MITAPSTITLVIYSPAVLTATSLLPAIHDTAILPAPNLIGNLAQGHQLQTDIHASQFLFLLLLVLNHTPAPDPYLTLAPALAPVHPADTPLCPDTIHIPPPKPTHSLITITPFPKIFPLPLTIPLLKFKTSNSLLNN